MAKQPNYESNHDKLYLRVNGKLQRCPKGTGLVLDPKVAEGLGDKVVKIGAKKTVEVDSKPASKSE